MKILRTPESRFSNIKDFPYVPNYTVIKTHDDSNLRIHHIDEGPKDGPILLVMHGQPVWSYLYSRMIPYLTDAGIRVIAPDLPGYGKSDKPAAREDYSYQRQVDWMNDWLKINDFNNLIFFGQDWGGLIGLRVIADQSDRFIKVAMGNTGLPYNPDVSEEVIDKIKAFRKSDIKLNPISMQKEIRKMDGKNISDDDSPSHPALSFMYWQKLCWDTKDLPIGFMMSSMMEKNSRIKFLIYFIFLRLGLRKLFPLKTNLDIAYEAPFPNPSYKMGPRAMPSHVPMIPDQSLEAQRKVREFYKNWNKPFLSVFAGDDPVTNGAEKDVLRMCPNAKSVPNIGGGHFFQWTRAKKLSNILIDFIKD